MPAKSGRGVLLNRPLLFGRKTKLFGQDLIELLASEHGVIGGQEELVRPDTLDFKREFLNLFVRSGRKPVGFFTQDRSAQIKIDR